MWISTDENRSQVSERMKAMWADMNPEVRAERVRKMAEGKRGKTYTPSQTKPVSALRTWAKRTREERLEIRRKQSETMKATWARRKALLGTTVEEAKVIGRPMKKVPLPPPLAPTPPVEIASPPSPSSPVVKPKVQILDWV